MRRALEQDHDLLGEDAPPNDLVLGAPALLGIFFALALVCAVCFGFGYSSGHGLRLPGPQTAATTTAAPAAPAAASKHESAESSAAPSTPPADPEALAAQKPAPGIGLSGGQPSSIAETPAPLATRHSSAADEQAWPPGESPAPTVRQAPALPALNADAAPVTAGAAAAPVSLMVQIAAVSRAADAQTLATALRHDGFASVVRTTTGDPFFHVQVGPFNSLQAAKAMRTRLTDGGYNAFIKP